MENTTPLWGPGCPWYADFEKFGPANVKWCEERLCALINEPANTWSNLGYIFVSLWILMYARKHKLRFGQLYALVVFLVGATSFAYHATNNFMTQIVDFLGMYFMVYFLLVINFMRLGWIAPRGVAPTFAGLTVFSLVLIPILDRIAVPFQIIVALAIVAITYTEAVNQIRGKKSGATWVVWPFWAGLGCFAVGVQFSIVDVKRIWCDPQNHWLQGHATWHWIGAIGLAFSFVYYRQFLPKKVSS